MDLRAASVLLLVLCAIIITTEGHIPNCCVKTLDGINWNLLKKAKKYDIQSDAGSCELKALILHVGRTRYCFDPKTEKTVKKWLKKKKKNPGKRQ